jgi:HSP20 family molecular chaperone IbpA
METSPGANRIPLRVNHDNTPGGESHQSYTSRQFSRSATDQNGNSYDMHNMYDETDRIKSRMREFEERCKKWREDFFSKTNSPSLFDRDFSEQRVPRYTAEAHSPTNGHFNSPAFAASSSMHKTYVEDLADGSGKKYKIEFDIGDFRQNEILITTNGRTLVLKGDREMKAGAATETKTFNRELTLPDYVDFDKMNAYLLENGDANNEKNVLVIEAPVVMEKYAYRRSAFDQTSPRHNFVNSTSNLHSPSSATGL